MSIKSELWLTNERPPFDPFDQSQAAQSHSQDIIWTLSAAGGEAGAGHGVLCPHWRQHPAALHTEPGPWSGNILCLWLVSNSFFWLISQGFSLAAGEGVWATSEDLRSSGLSYCVNSLWTSLDQSQPWKDQSCSSHYEVTFSFSM